ncbi:hypothetical protein Tco_0951832 [Tanacetum coccineum]|uniref:Retrotransposon gag domain-containing protein n=1 Tax=Tanacetum coccineum TaxID=301880 RepID=A0ABQ5DW12_9ASTR
MTRSSTEELLSPFENPEQKFCSRRRLFDTPSLVESNSLEFDHNFDIEEQSEEEVRETMTETMDQYMNKTRGDYWSGVTRPTINQDTHFELKGQFLKELRDNTFSGLEHEDANEHTEKVLEIVDIFHIPKVTQDQIMLRAFPVSLTGAASMWLRNQPSGSITTWEERFKELLMKYPQHYLTDMQEVILFYNGLDVPTRQILDSKGAIPSKTVIDDKIAIYKMAEYSQKWHNGTSSRTKSTKTSDGLAAIQAQLNNLGREIKKVNEKVYAAQVGCELCKGPHYTKDYPQKEEGKTLEEAYYTQFGAPYQPGGQYRAAGPGFYQQNNGNSSHEENSNIIKEIQASTDAAIKNQGASNKTLEIQIGQISKIRHVGCGPYAVSGTQLRSLFSETVPFPRRLQNCAYDDWREAQDVKILDAYDHTLLQKEKDLGSFTLPCFIHNICFDKALVDLGASVSVMPFSTDTNLGLGILSHTRLTIELADRTIKQPRGIAENVLVRIGKFIFPIDFIILDIPEDEDVPLILKRLFLSTAHSKIDVFKRKITLRVGEEKLVFKSFTIIDDDDMTKDVVLDMKFCKKTFAEKYGWVYSEKDMVELIPGHVCKLVNTLFAQESFG